MNTTVVSSPDTRGRSASNQLRGNPLSQGATPSIDIITHTDAVSVGNSPESKQSEKKVTGPSQDWGFYAMTPRIVRTHYKQLSHTEKWLYVCLKDLCGDEGMCYRSLRTLADETDLSIGNLSTGIRHLHEAGLIHAEKKRRSANPSAKEVWHISIVDIWQANANYCSHPKQQCSNFEQSPENVQKMNNNVQILNDTPAKRSKNEQQCSNFETEEGKGKKNILEEETREEGRGASLEPITEPFPSLPAFPPSLETEKKELTWETIDATTPHCSEAIAIIATHYLGAAKVSQADASAFVAKTQSVATLTGPHEVRKQLVRNITFLLYSQAPSNWFSKGNRREGLTFAKVVAWHDDYTRKSNAAGWEPPIDKVPGWYHADEIVSQQEQPTNEENYFAGMSEAEAASLTLRIQAEYPGMKITWGNLPQGRFTVGLWQGQNERGKDDWLDFYQSWEWAQRGDDPRFGYVLEAYQQCRLAEVA